MTDIPAADRIVTSSDNLPPDPLVPIKAHVDALVANANAWLHAVPVIETPDVAAKCEDFYDRLRKEAKKLDAYRKTANKPHDDAIKANNAAFRGLLAPIEAAQILLGKLRDAWLKRERDRQDRERIETARRAAEAQAAAEAARKAAEKATTVEDIVLADEAEEAAAAAIAAADAAQAAKPQIKGEYTARAGSLRTFWSATITDYRAALAHYADDAKVREAVQMLANADARAMKEAFDVPGCRAVSEERGV